MPAAIGPNVTAVAPHRHITALALFGWGLGGLLAVIAVVAIVLLLQ